MYEQLMLFVRRNAKLIVVQIKNPLTAFAVVGVAYWICITEAQKRSLSVPCPCSALPRQSVQAPSVLGTTRFLKSVHP